MQHYPLNLTSGTVSPVSLHDPSLLELKQFIEACMNFQQKIKLYNTLSRKKEIFEPIDENNVRLYVCGPTVYDYAHIGNARPAIVFDILFRLLRHIYGENHVTYVRNITDVDDKINARAARDYPDLELNKAIAKVTKQTTEQYHKDVKALLCLEPTYEPRATQHIEGMKKMIATLIEKNHAYQAGGEVLFDVSSMKNYGTLSKRKLDEQQAGARIEVKSHKKNAGDFVLWKLSSENEPGWDSEWGRGRPGWHLECSVMSEALLGEVFDIHGGGLDLIFPHHENEIAQSCCAHDNDKMANYWLHNGFLQVEGQKMSKSLGNFITINDLLETNKFGGKKWAGDVLRLAMLMTNYKEPIDFSVARLEEAEKILKKWKARILELGLVFEEENRQEIEALGPCSKLLAALANDLDMSGVISHLHRHASGKKLHNAGRLFGSLQLLGLVSFDSMQQFQKAQEEQNSNVDRKNIEQLISLRLKALKEKNWAKADEIRNDLAAKGILLKDGKDETTGERKTSWEIKQ